MIKAMESLGTWMLGRIVPAVHAAAGCAPEESCQLCATCYFKQCTLNGDCKWLCGSCGSSCNGLAGAQAVSLC